MSTPTLTLIEGGTPGATKPSTFLADPYFALSVEYIAGLSTAKELGVSPDPLKEILVRTARLLRDREMARAGR